MAYDPIIQYAEDSVHITGDKGVQALAVRKDTAVALGADGDYMPPIVDSTGKLHVNVGTSALPSGASTLAEQQSQTTLLTTIAGDTTDIEAAVELIDDTVATLGTTTYTETTTKGLIVGAVRRDADTTLVDTTNEVAPLQVNAAGQLKVALITSLPAGTNGIGKLTANSGVDIGDVDVTSLPSIPAGTNNIGDVDVLTVNGVAPAFGSGARGATVQRVTIATDDVVPASQSGTWNVGTVTTVTTVSTVSALGTGTTGPQKAEDVAHSTGDMGVAVWSVGNEAQSTFAADGDYIPFATDVKGNTLVTGNIAHDGADAGRPIKIGGRARTSEIAAVASDDRVDAIFDKAGKQITLPYALPENFVSGAITSAMTGTTSTSLISAPAGSLRNYITTIIVSNSHATVGTDVIIQDGNGGTTLLTIPAAAVYGGATITLPTPLRQPTTATALYCANVTTGASTKVSAVGYTGL